MLSKDVAPSVEFAVLGCEATAVPVASIAIDVCCDKFFFYARNQTARPSLCLLDLFPEKVSPPELDWRYCSSPAGISYYTRAAGIP